MLIAVARPQAQVHAVDINPKALHFAQTNATVAGLKNMECCHSDILSGLSGNFDLIVANPPYMKDTQRRAYRHGGDALGADLSVRILRESLDRLTPGGSLVLYTGVAMVGEHDPFSRPCRPISTMRHWHGRTASWTRMSSAKSCLKRATRTWTVSQRSNW